jgi:hypothetical protein
MATSKRERKTDRRVRVRGVRRNPPDLKKLAGALIDLAQAQAEADAAAEHVRRETHSQRAATEGPPTKDAA